ncbi:hypothetical protein CR513_13983, partial [Mucuna pruriens]
MRSDMELPQQQSLKVQYGFSRNPNSENSTNMLGFADSSSVANSMLATADSTKMTKIDGYMPTISDLVNNYKRPYQIGVIAGDASSFVSLCAKPEVKPNPESVDCCVSRVVESKLMENNNDRTLKELATLDVVYRPWCIQYPQLEPSQTYELKSSLIHLLPKFHGLVGEDPHKHLKEFDVVCTTTRP